MPTTLMSEPKLVMVETFLNRLDAELASSVLMAAGIDAVVSPDDAGGAYPGVAVLRVRLLVREEESELWLIGAAAIIGLVLNGAP